jgi:DNA-binding response OmpR family regulator
MAARVLAVQQRLDVDDVEWAIAPDGETACSWADRDAFDTVVVDLSLPVLDGWLVLATLGAISGRPRLIAVVPDRAQVARAHKLGADLCLLAGTALHARALEPAWQRHPAINFRRPMTTGATA